jgi:hypothetical protein
MVCENYRDMSPHEKILFIGQLTHACMSNETLFEMGKEIIELAQLLRVFEKVTILPPPKIEQYEQGFN